MRSFAVFRSSKCAYTLARVEYLILAILGLVQSGIYEQWSADLNIASSAGYIALQSSPHGETQCYYWRRFAVLC